MCISASRPAGSWPARLHLHVHSHLRAIANARTARLPRTQSAARSLGRLRRRFVSSFTLAPPSARCASLSLGPVSKPTHCPPHTPIPSHCLQPAWASGGKHVARSGDKSSPGQPSEADIQPGRVNAKGALHAHRDSCTRSTQLHSAELVTCLHSRGRESIH